LLLAVGSIVYHLITAKHNLVYFKKYFIRVDTKLKNQHQKKAKVAKLKENTSARPTLLSSHISNHNHSPRKQTLRAMVMYY